MFGGFCLCVTRQCDCEMSAVKSKRVQIDRLLPRKIATNEQMLKFDILMTADTPQNRPTGSFDVQ